MTAAKGRRRHSFDVMLTFNSKDREVVRELVALLRDRSLNVWFDEDEIVPGQLWQESLEHAIQNSKCLIVAIGEAGLGPWQHLEVRGAIDGFVQRGAPVIPVLLPGAPNPIDLTGFLKQFHLADLRQGMGGEPLDRLLKGIVANRPRRASRHIPGTPRERDPGKVLGGAPPHPRLVIGRELAVTQLKRRVGITRGRTGTDSTRSITIVRGLPGVGKSTLLATLAHDPGILSAFTDGLLWTALGNSPDLGDTLSRWAAALGATSAPGDATLLVERLSAQISTRRMLLLVDDAWQAEHAEPFLRMSGQNCSVLVSTRLNSVADLLALSPGDVYHVPPLDQEFALTLLEHLAPNVVREHRDECRELVADLEGLPLAIQVAGRLLRISSSRNEDVTGLLGEIRADARRLLDEPVPSDLADLVNQTTSTVAAVLRKSTERLDEHTRRRFASLGALAPKPATFDATHASLLWNTTKPDARKTINSLIDHGLVEPASKSWYQIHAVLVALARSMMPEADDGSNDPSR